MYLTWQENGVWHGAVLLHTATARVRVKGKGTKQGGARCWEGGGGGDQGFGAAKGIFNI